MHARVVLGVGKGVLFRELSHTKHTQARNWIKELKRMLGDKVTLCIVGNKIDLEKQRTVIEKDALE